MRALPAVVALTLAFGVLPFGLGAGVTGGRAASNSVPVSAADHDVAVPAPAEFVPAPCAALPITNVRIDANGSGNSDLILVTTTAKISGRNGDDCLVGGLEDHHLSGSRGDDILLGGLGDDVLEGDQDSDQLFGGPGDDILDGGKGFDTCTGGPGADTFVDCEVITDSTPAEGDVVL